MKAVSFVDCYTDLNHESSRNFEGSFFILLSENSSSESLGALNGLAQTIACTMRIFAPFISSSLFSLSQEKNLLGGTMVFWFNALLGVGGFWMSLKIAKAPKKDDDE